MNISGNFEIKDFKSNVLIGGVAVRVSVGLNYTTYQVSAQDKIILYLWK